MFALLIISTLSSTVIQTQFDSGEVSESEQEYELSDSQKLTLADLNEKLSVSSRTNHTSSSPIWGWAVKAGGPRHDGSTGIAVDSSGNAYVIGFFSRNASFGSTTLSAGLFNFDIFVAKLDSTGAWQWAVRAGGSGLDADDHGLGIAVDSSGNAYVTGSFDHGYGVNNASFGSTSLTSSGDEDIFVAKLNSTGAWQWAVKAGGTGADRGDGIAVDSSGNAYVTGFFSNNSSFGSTYLYFNGSHTFIAKLNSTGGWQWAVKAGGYYAACPLCRHGNGIAVDSSGNAYVSGSFGNNASFGSTSLTSSGGLDIFVAKLNSTGAWQWAVKAGGTGGDRGMGIAVDSSGNAYVTGRFENNASFGSINLYGWMSQNIFVAKLNSTGGWQWVVKAVGNNWNMAYGIAVDSSGNAYVTGEFINTASFGSTSLNNTGLPDIFVAKLNSTGHWQWALKAGGPSNSDSGTGIAVDSSGVYVTGDFQREIIEGYRRGWNT
jgi:hypothetical protein